MTSRINPTTDGRDTHMGANRDFTPARGGTATLTRPGSRTHGDASRRPEAYAPTPRARPVAPHVPHAARKGRLGSKQVVSVRGRRVTVASETRRKFSTVTLIALPLLVAGVVLAMFLSGLSTNQSFTVQQLQNRERNLSNEVESLNRDLEDLRSSAEIAQRGSEAGMVVPLQPGIIANDGNGGVNEQRPADPGKVQKVMDVNGAPVQAGRASSDRSATRDLGGNLTTVPGGNVLGRGTAQPGTQPGAPAANQPANPQDAQPAAPAPQRSNLAPYQPNVPAAH